MKIVSLRAENFKRLSAVEITPAGNVVEITGKNAQGKSSILDAIMAALGGTKLAPSKPVRKGEEKAVISLNLGKLIVTRRFTEAGGTSLTVENDEGAQYKSPQTMLDALLGELTFDPLAFSKMKPAEQFDELRRIAKLGDEIDQLDKANTDDFAARTDVNRKAKDARAAAAAILVPEDLPDGQVDTAALIDELQRAGEVNASIESRKVARDNARQQIEANAEAIRRIENSVPVEANAINRRCAEQVADLQRQIDALTARMAEVQENARVEVENLHARAEAQIKDLSDTSAKLQKRLDDAPPLPEPVDVTALRERIANAERANKGVAAREQRDAKVKEAEAAEAESAALTEAMEERKTKRLALIKAADMPVPGLGLGEGEVLYNGIPLDQASGAEQLRVSVAIAMAANPRLRVLRIKEGSLLDEDGMKLLAEMAAAADYQVWVERVDSSGKVGIVIEDGMVKADNRPAPATEAAE